jgi:hypothetical protein
LEVASGQGGSQEPALCLSPFPRHQAKNLEDGARKNYRNVKPASKVEHRINHQQQADEAE